MPESQSTTSDDSTRSDATRRARAKLGFFRHLLMYVLVIGGLAAINLSSGEYLWFMWPAAAWGIGLIAHAVDVYLFSDNFLRRMTERELRRERLRAGGPQRSDVLPKDRARSAG